ncbi:MAG TPA: copper resistance system multicopper oxidase, partial [Gammaproteobacteria bacterium]|nr:copper resistance system multicopper oxidase [Gammaproteobacteria bacterium]
SGAEIDLTIASSAVNFTGSPSLATLVNGSLPGPLLRWREGDTVSIRARNALSEQASIHWHGIVLPAAMDGVPGLSFGGIAPGGSYLYRFEVRQSGTYWYHAHSGFTEQTGVYGPIVIDPREAPPFAYDREHVILLSDWTDMSPNRLYALLKKQSDYFNHNRRTLGTFIHDVKDDGFGGALRDRFAWGRMRMSPADLADVSGHAYTYLMNGVTPAGNWTGLFAPGERVLLRIINGSAMTYFDVRIPGLKMTVVAVDGQYVHPVTGDEIRMAAAETYDVIVEPAGADAFTIFAQSMDRSGYARGTLSVREGLDAPVPEVDKIVYLTMADMGMEHGASDHSDMPGMAHSMPGMPGMDHSTPAAGTAPSEAGAAAAQPEHMQTHPASERGNPNVDMQTMMPSTRLDDPGIGLRDNGRRVLTYADFKTLFPDPDGRDPGRTIELHLTGHMARYLWSFDGIPFGSSEPLELRYGERVRIVLVNDTMMEHPIHLHGMWSDLEDESGAFHLRKHTLSVPTGAKRAYRVSADALGPWAYHCHLLYHMHSGMFREVRVDV